MENKDVLVGTIVSAKGIKGEVKIKTYTLDPLSLKDYNLFINVFGKIKKTYIKKSYIHKNLLVAFLDGITSVEEAEKLIGTNIFIKREDMPNIDLENNDGNYYFIDIIGLKVKNIKGDIIGRISNVDNYGASDVIEIKTSTNVFMIPFIKEFVIEVNLKNKYIVIADYIES